MDDVLRTWVDITILYGENACLIIFPSKILRVFHWLWWGTRGPLDRVVLVRSTPYTELQASVL